VGHGHSPVRLSAWQCPFLRVIAAALRPVTGSPGLGLLRRLCPTPGRSADGVPSPEFHAGRVTPGQTKGGSRVHLLIARRRRHPTRPLRHRRGDPAARHHGLPIRTPTLREVPRRRDEAGGCASPPTQIRQVLPGASLRGVNAGSSRMPVRRDHTRAVWQYRHAVALSGLLPPATGTSRVRLPPASPPRCDRTTVQVSHLSSINKRLTAHRRCDAPTGRSCAGRHRRAP